MKQALRECLGKLIDDFVVLFKDTGADCLRTEMAACANQKSIQKLTQTQKAILNPYIFQINKSMDIWNGIIKDLEQVAKHIKNDNTPELLKCLKKITSKTTDLTKILSGLVVEMGSYIPGPIGIVCSLCLAITCFASGNILGGFMNLFGCIPCGKVVGKSGRAFSNKFANGIKKIIEQSGIERFSPQWTKDMFFKYQSEFQNTLKKHTQELDNAIELLKETSNNLFKPKFDILW